MVTESMSLGIVLERREIDHPWESHSWTATISPERHDLQSKADISRYRRVRATGAGGHGWPATASMLISVIIR